MHEESNVDNFAEICRLENVVDKRKKSVANLLDMRLAEKMDRESYQMKCKELMDKISEAELKIDSFETQSNISEDEITKNAKRYKWQWGRLPYNVTGMIFISPYVNCSVFFTILT